MAELKLEIITPEKVAYSDTVQSVVLPGTEGEMGALANHVPMVTMLSPGDLQVSKDGKIVDLAVGEGFVEVTAHHVTVLTDMALEASEIDEDQAQKAIERAQEALKNEPADSDEAKMLMATVQRSMAQLNVKKRWRK
ncbi:MAG: ATP synthase F1 subunit epsilon [Verrucomicrobiota bacterium]